MDNLNLTSNLPQNCWIGDPTVFYEPLITQYYYQYPIYGPFKETIYIESKSKLEQAFNIAKHLIDKKTVKSEKVKDFLDLVNVIMEAI